MYAQKSNLLHFSTTGYNNCNTWLVDCWSKSWLENKRCCYFSLILFGIWYWADWSEKEECKFFLPLASQNEVRLSLQLDMHTTFKYRYMFIHILKCSHAGIIISKRNQEQEKRQVCDLSVRRSMWVHGGEEGKAERQTDTMETVKFRGENVTDWFDTSVVVTIPLSPVSTIWTGHVSFFIKHNVCPYNLIYSSDAAADDGCYKII